MFSFCLFLARRPGVTLVVLNAMGRCIRYLLSNGCVVEKSNDDIEVFLGH